MEVLTKTELNDIKGGSKTVWFVVGGFVVLAIGIFCGFFQK